MLLKLKEAHGVVHQNVGVEYKQLVGPLFFLAGLLFFGACVATDVVISLGAMTGVKTSSVSGAVFLLLDFFATLRR